MKNLIVFLVSIFGLTSHVFGQDLIFKSGFEFGAYHVHRWSERESGHWFDERCCDEM